MPAVRDLTAPRLDLQVVGPVCIDVNVDAQGATTQVVGGAAMCAAAAAASLGHRVEVVTTLAEQDQGLLAGFPDSVEQVSVLPSARTTSIRNVYATHDQERRTSYALAQADPMSPAGVPRRPVAVQHLAGLMVGDYQEGMVEELSARADLAVDMQCLLRRRDPSSGLLRPSGFRAGPEFYSLIRFLKVDTAEGEQLTGLTDRREIARALHDLGAQEVMVSNAQEIVVHNGSETHVCPLRPRNLTGRTGRGDTVFSAYITERVRHGARQALVTACAAVSLKMEAPGPLLCGRGDVERYLRSFYSDILSSNEVNPHDS